MDGMDRKIEKNSKISKKIVYISIGILLLLLFMLTLHH